MKKYAFIVLAAILAAAGWQSFFTAPAESVSAAAADDSVLLDFNGLSDVGTVIAQQDLSAYGVSKSVLSLTSENADEETAMKVALDRDAARYCQSLSYKDTTHTAAVFRDADPSGYLRIWLYNPDAEEIGICVQLSAGASTAMLSPEKAKLTRCDGAAVALKIGNPSGAGDFHVMVPAGFAGWIAWPLNAALEQAWSSPLLSSIALTSLFKLDLRPQAPGGAAGYILDDIVLSASASGRVRSYQDPAAAGLAEKKQELITMIEGFLGKTPRTVPMAQYDPDSDPDSGANAWSEIRAITFDGPETGGKKTKVFAYVGFPKSASPSAKVPAVVLIHGGGGHAFAEWVKMWNDKGYAAIAMDNTGYFPSPAGKGVAGRESDFYKDPAYWQYGLYGDFAESGYGNAPNNDGMGSSAGEIDTQWMYHAVVQSILAHNILLADSRVDTARTGLVGISWGGIIGSIAIGYDTRYAFAVPIYGAGYLDKGLSYMKDYFSPTATKTLWSAADRFGKVRFPVFWIGWSSDPSFSIQSNSLSYLDTKAAGSILGMRMDWSHSHSSGWSPAEIYRFADSAVKGGDPLTSCLTEPGPYRNFSFTVKTPKDAVSVEAKAYYITGKMTYSMNGALTPVHKVPTIDQTWLTSFCTVSGNTVKGSLPAAAYGFYVEIRTRTASGTFITSTHYVDEILGEGSTDESDGSSAALSSSADSSGRQDSTPASGGSNTSESGSTVSGSGGADIGSSSPGSGTAESLAASSDTGSGSAPGPGRPNNGAVTAVWLTAVFCLAAGAGAFVWIRRRRRAGGP